MNWIDASDVAVVQWVNGLAGHWPIFDLIIIRLFRLDTVRHLPLVAVLVWAWYSDPGDGSRRRHVFDGIVGYLISIVATRLAQGLMPHRPRPALAGTFHFEMPVGGFASDWSSFPSDTAAQAFALVVAIWMISRRLGIAAALWATAVICFPRLYGGFHYPSDLLVGGIFGAAATIAVARRPLGLNAAAAAMDRLEVNYRPWFYVFGFCLLFEITGHFEDAREALNIGKHIIQPMLNLLPDST